MREGLRIAAGAALLTVAACSSDPAPDVNDIEWDEVNVAETKPIPRYDERDGDIYLYVAEVSEEDRQKGKSAGDVIGFRYLGTAKELYRLQHVNDGGTPFAVSECTNPCRVITTRSNSGRVSRLGFSEESIIGTAFTDAFNGLLEPVEAPVAPAKPKPSATEQVSTAADAELDPEIERLNELCRGGSGDDEATLEACFKRDELMGGADVSEPAV